MAPSRVSAEELSKLLGPDPAAQSPAYRSLADAIRLLVADGRLLYGTRLPSERDLTVALGLSRTTVTRAYALLRERGYLSSRHGSGSVVTVPGGPQTTTPNVLDPGPSEGRWLDLTCAAPAAPPGLAAAYATAVEQLPAHLAGPGYHPLGLPALRKAIAARFRSRGLPTDAEQIIVTSGALAALALIARAYLRPGDRVLMESPTYPNSIATMRRAGARLVGVPCPPTGLEPRVVDTLVRQSLPRLAVLIVDYQNPTGTVLSAWGREQVAATFAAHQVLPVVDETLCELSLDEDDLGSADAGGSPGGQRAGAGAAPAPFAWFAGSTLTVGSASKSHWGGLRLGWIRAPHSQIGRLLTARLSLDLGAAPLEQLVLADVLGGNGPVVSPQRRWALASARDALLETVATYLPDWQVRRPPGGLSLWFRLPLPRSSAVTAAAERHGVLLAPGSSFASDGTDLEYHLRLPYTLAVDDLRSAVESIALAWEQARSDRSPRASKRPIVA